MTGLSEVTSRKEFHDFRRIARILFRNLLLISVVVLAGIPIYYAALKATRDNVVQESYNSFQTGFAQFDGMMQNLANLSDTIAAEPAVEHLALVQGDMATPDYSYLRSAQIFMSQTLTSDSIVKNAYCLFSNNRIFLSRTLASPDLGTVYGSFFLVDGVTPGQWSLDVAGVRNRITFLYNKKSNWTFSPQADQSMADTIQLAVRPVNPGLLTSDSVLVYILDANQLYSCFGSRALLKDSFFYIANAKGDPVVRKNYAGGALPVSRGIQKVTVGKVRYTVMQAQSQYFGVRAVMGVPESYYAQVLRPMRNIILLYGILFSLVALSASALLAMRQYSPLKRLMDSLKDVISDPVDAPADKNEYGYISAAVRSLDSKNRCYETELAFVSASLYSNMLEDLLTGKIQTDMDEEKCTTMFGFVSQRFCVCSVRLAGTVLKEDGGMGVIMRINSAIKETVSQQLGYPVYFYNAGLHYVRVLFNLFDGASDDPAPISRCMSRAVCSVKESCGDSIVCGIGGICDGIRQVHISTMQARNALWLSDENSPVHIWSDRREQNGGMLVDGRLAQRLEEILSIGNPQYVEEFFSLLQKNIGKSQAFSEVEICQAFYTIRNTLESVAQKLGNPGFSVALPAYSQQLGARELFRLFYAPSLTICRYISSRQMKKDDSQRNEIVEFIRQNYADSNLCAMTIANQFFVSEKYVFTIVKNMTGQSLGDYIESVRFARVEELLRGDAEIIGIPKMVGFHSVNTFYKSFKRRFGVSPGKWRSLERESADMPVSDNP